MAISTSAPSTSPLSPPSFRTASRRTARRRAGRTAAPRPRERSRGRLRRGSRSGRRAWRRRGRARRTTAARTARHRAEHQGRPGRPGRAGGVRPAHASMTASRPASTPDAASRPCRGGGRSRGSATDTWIASTNTSATTAKAPTRRVAHDREGALAVAPGAEPVREVGQTVQVQAAGEQRPAAPRPTRAGSRVASRCCSRPVRGPGSTRRAATTAEHEPDQRGERHGPAGPLPVDRSGRRTGTIVSRLTASRRPGDHAARDRSGPARSHRVAEGARQVGEQVRGRLEDGARRAAPRAVAEPGRRGRARGQSQLGECGPAPPAPADGAAACHQSCASGLEPSAATSAAAQETAPSSSTGVRREPALTSSPVRTRDARPADQPQQGRVVRRRVTPARAAQARRGSRRRRARPGRSSMPVALPAPESVPTIATGSRPSSAATSVAAAVRSASRPAVSSRRRAGRVPASASSSAT